MFNLGYKEVIINDTSGIINDGGIINVPGFLSFPESYITQISHPPVGDPPTDPRAGNSGVAEIATWGNLPSNGDYADIQIVIRRFGTDYRENVRFNAVKTTEFDLAGGYAQWLVDYVYSDGKEKKFDIVSNGNGTFTTTIQPGYEKYYISQIRIRPGYDTEIEKAHKQYSMTKTIDTEGSPGVNVGWQLVDSRRIPTLDNYAPYSNKHGGNETEVFDMNALFDEYSFTVLQSDLDGAPHDYIGHNYVNQGDAGSKGINVVIYVPHRYIWP